MAMFTNNAHFLAYGATDQKTLRTAGESYTGVLVPGTIAAWQRKGTGGFVLTLSADGGPSKPYAIDPRFPLFQQSLESPKQSHIALAEAIFDDAALIRGQDPTPASFSDDRLRSLARQWVRFNTKYQTDAADDFDKYARRLGRPITVEDAQAPERVLAPYFMAESSDDAWWRLSNKLYEYASDEADGVIRCTRVVAATSADALVALLDEVPDGEEVAIWVSGLNEPSVEAVQLAAYRSAIERSSARGLRMFALYGGFFSVLLASSGLTGAAHGVGFSEHRAWRELPSSGAAPARYYLQAVHRYVSRDIAQQLWLQDPSLVTCNCPGCRDREPLSLDYHELMEHSVRCRANEIVEWSGIVPSDAANILIEEYEEFVECVEGLEIPPRIRATSLKAAEHLPAFSAALTD